MKKSDIKRQLRTEAELFVPDNKEQIMRKLSIDTRPKFKRKFLNFSFKFSLVFTIILVSIIGFSLTQTTPVAASNSIVTIEINPAFELELDKDDNIIDIRGLNLDGVLVLESLNGNGWNNLTKTEVLNNIIDISIRLGYLNANNTINISSINTDLKKETAIANTFRTDLENAIANKQLQINIKNNNDNEDYKALARKHKVSIGKMNLIQRARQIDNSLTIESAIKMTPKQLNEIVNQYNKQKNDDFKEKLETQIETFEEYKERIIQELKDHKDIFKDYIETTIETIEDMIDNPNISQAEIELQIRNLIQYLNIEDYDFNPDDEDDDINDYYLEVLDDIKDITEDYYDELEDYIEDLLEEIISDMKKDIKDRIEDNPDDINFDYDFDDDLDDLIRNRNQGKQNGNKRGNN